VRQVRRVYPQLLTRGYILLRIESGKQSALGFQGDSIKAGPGPMTALSTRTVIGEMFRWDVGMLGWPGCPILKPLGYDMGNVRLRASKRTFICAGPVAQ
jgi:hypothetical protein